MDENAPKEAKLLGGESHFYHEDHGFKEANLTLPTLRRLLRLWKFNGRKGGARVRVLNGGNFKHLSLNTQWLHRRRITSWRAMAYALDYDAVNNTYCRKHKAYRPQVTSSGHGLRIIGRWENPYKYDIDKAMEELKQSPYYDQLTSGEMRSTFLLYRGRREQQEKLALLDAGQA